MGDDHLDVLRRYAPYHHDVPGGRWLTLLMNRIPPPLFAAAFTSWVRATWQCACRGSGIAFVRIGRLVRYPRAAVIEYERRQLRHSTSE